MSSPVITVVENVSLAEAQLLIKTQCHSFMCNKTVLINRDLKGIISELLINIANNPGVLIKEIKRCIKKRTKTNTRTFNRFDSDFNFKKNIPLSYFSILPVKLI
jgi:CBS domain-containing protein